jgi:pimeloyl-ACP methyl ester carboxylesterase
MPNQLSMGELYAVSGRKLFLCRSGEGGPPVVFLPGAGLVGLDYFNLQSSISEFTTGVLYDRAGTGWSDRIELPRSAAEVAGELRELLQAAGVPGPYLLAGHSLGGMYARRYAQLFPDEVAGLLLLDPGHEDMYSYLPDRARDLNEQMKPDLQSLPELTPEQLDASRTALRQLYAQWPDELREPLVEYHVTDWRIGLEETTNFETAIFDELRAGGDIPDVPLLVLTANGMNPYWNNYLSPEDQRAAHAGIHAMHADLAKSTSRGEHRLIDDASHQYLHIEQSEAVLQALRDLLERSR